MQLEVGKKYNYPHAMRGPVVVTLIGFHGDAAYFTTETPHGMIPAGEDFVMLDTGEYAPSDSFGVVLDPDGTLDSLGVIPYNEK